MIITREQRVLQRLSELHFAKEQLRSLGCTIRTSSADGQQLGAAVLSIANWLHSLIQNMDLDFNGYVEQSTTTERAKQ